MNNQIVYEDYDEDDEILDFIDNGLPRQLYERSSHFYNLDDVSFRRRFRLSKQSVLQILGQIEHMLEFPFAGNNVVSPVNQLLTCLRLYATGGHLQTVADFSGMHVSTVCRIVKRVTEALLG